MTQLKSMFLLIVGTTTVILYLVWTSQGKEMVRYTYPEVVKLCYYHPEVSHPVLQ